MSHLSKGIISILVIDLAPKRHKSIVSKAYLKFRNWQAEHEWQRKCHVLHGTPWPLQRWRNATELIYREVVISRWPWTNGAIFRWHKLRFSKIGSIFVKHFCYTSKLVLAHVSSGVTFFARMLYFSFAGSETKFSQLEVPFR